MGKNPRVRANIEVKLRLVRKERVCLAKGCNIHIKFNSVSATHKRVYGPMEGVWSVAL